MRRLAFALLFGTLLAVSPAFANWSLDASHTTVGFRVKHLAISTVYGTFNDFTGNFQADDSGKLTSMSGTIKTQSVDTNNTKRDDHLRNADFFDSEKYPDMTFESTSVTIDDKGATTVAGKLTIKGVTKDVTLKGMFSGARTVNFGQGDQTHAGYSLETTINRQDFGLTFNALMDGVQAVSDEVAITIEFEITRPGAKK